MYKVRWIGYTERNDTWEEAKHLQKCGKLIKEYWKSARCQSSDIKGNNGCAAASKLLVAKQKSEHESPRTLELDEEDEYEIEQILSHQWSGNDERTEVYVAAA